MFAKLYRRGLCMDGGRVMKFQLFKGTYSVLLFLAVLGLFTMLSRQAGDGFALLMWFGLIAIASAGLMSTDNDSLAMGGAALGLASTLYLKWGGPKVTRGALLVDLSVGAYVLLTITLAIIWRVRKRDHSA